MKKLLFLLLIFSSYCQAQLKPGTVFPTVDFSDFATQAQINGVKSDVSSLKSQIAAQQKKIDSLSNSKGNPVVVVPVMDTCKRGPKILGISAITSTSITPKFDGQDVFKIKYTINGDNVLIVDSLVPTNNQPVIKFPTPLKSGVYTLTFEGLNCTGKSTRQFTISSDTSPPVVVLPNCTKQISFVISNVTKSSVYVKFDAENLTALTLELVNNANVTIKSTSYNPTSNTLFFPFNEQANGNYKIRLTAINCTQAPVEVPFSISDNTGAVTPPVVVPPTIVASDRNIIMNMTGYGWDINDITGINKDWRDRIDNFQSLQYNGEKFSGINAVTLTVRWYDYEPKEGQFRDDKLIDAINWCKARNLKMYVFFWPYRELKDNFLPRSDMAHAGGVRDQWGNVVDSLFVIENNKYTLAPNSWLALAKLENATKHLAQVLVKYQGFKVPIRSGYGETEEVFMPTMKRFDLQSDGSIWATTIGLTSYAPVDRAAWKIYLASRGLPDAPAPISPNPNNAWDTGNFWNSSPIGKAWYNFMSQGLTNVQEAFRKGIQAGGGFSMGVYPDAGAAQSAWIGTYPLNKIFAGNDGVYSSDGGTIYDLDRKIFAIDVNRGTFPNSKVAFEFDPEDISAEGNSKYGTPINSGLFLKYAKSGFERGADYLFLSMAFSSGDGGRRNNINDLAPALYSLQKDYIQKKEITSTPQGDPFSWKITSYSGTQGYWDTWKNSGGGLDKQIKVKIE